jgi:hypothetical protein
MTPELASFIAEARRAGLDLPSIRLLLTDAGWPEADVARALLAHALPGVALPERTRVSTARDTFLHLVALTGCLTSLTSLVALLFQFLDRWLPDAALLSYGQDLSGMRWALACLLVGGAIYAFVAVRLHREARAHPEKLQASVRRWLGSLLLFLLVCVLLGDLITVVYTLLQGELTLRFLLKAGSLSLLCGLPFLYTQRTLAMDAAAYQSSSWHRAYAWAGGSLVVLATVVAFSLIGSPLTSRLQALDDRRLSDLQSLQQAVISYVGGERLLDREAEPRALPATLDLVLKEGYIYDRSTLLDPETQAPYAYEVLPDGSFRLCATFSLERNSDFSSDWNHPAGHTCFDKRPSALLP